MNVKNAELESLKLINGLIRDAGETTGESYNTLTDAHQALKNGYGKGGENGYPYIDSSVVTDYSFFFASGTRKELLGKVETINAESLYNMYDGNEEVTAVSHDMSNVKNAQSMLNGCINLVSADLYNSNKLEHAEALFCNCKSLTVVPEIDISGCTDGSNMYNNVPVIKMPYLDTSNLMYCNSMFNGQYANNNIVFSNELDMSNCVDCSSMFYNRNNTTMPLINTKNVTTFRLAFLANRFTEAELDLTSCSDMRTAFKDCIKLQTLVLNNVNAIASSSYWESCFAGCKNLVNLTVNQLVANSGSTTRIYLDFMDCVNLSGESLHNIVRALVNNNKLLRYPVRLPKGALSKLSDDDKAYADAEQNINLIEP